MNFILDNQQELIKKTAREFANDILRPGVIERDEKSLFPKNEIIQMGELGFMGMMVPEKFGGSGLDTLSYCLALEEISKVDASVGVIMSVNNSLVCNLLYKYGNEHQKNKFCFYQIKKHCHLSPHLPISNHNPFQSIFFSYF